jgi:hypothetical protein
MSPFKFYVGAFALIFAAMSFLTWCAHPPVILDGTVIVTESCRSYDSGIEERIFVKK